MKILGEALKMIIKSNSFQDRVRYNYSKYKSFYLLSLTLIATLLISYLTVACQQTIPIELSFLIPEEEMTAWETVIVDFEAGHPNIKIRADTSDISGIDYTTDQRKGRYLADLQAKTATHDLVYMDTVWTSQFIPYLKDINPWIKRDKLDTDDFLDYELSTGREEDGLYRIPMNVNMGILYYRKDILEDMNLSIPFTLEELRQSVSTAKQLSKIEFGYLWQGASYEGLIVNFLEVMHNFGGVWIDLDMKKIGLEDPESIQSAKLLRQLIEEDISPSSVTSHVERSSFEKFMEGKTLFLRSWPSFWSEIQRREWDDKVGITRPFSFTDIPGNGCLGGWGFGIPKSAKHPNEAWEAIKYFTSAEAQEKFILTYSFLPSRKSIYQSPKIASKYPFMPEMLNYLEKSSVLRPSLKKYDVVSEILQTALGSILNGEESAEVALRKAQSDTEVQMGLQES